MRSAFDPWRTLTCRVIGIRERNMLDDLKALTEPGVRNGVLSWLSGDARALAYCVRAANG
jgi:hypothetical protein